ncbi:MAG TPA: NADH-quinone oxidoreductase subunit NuoF [Firmicutes bacterium]|nr:NADH-quinone oxidoreductase subunit NuoF [Bacillota bacterium]
MKTQAYKVRVGLGTCGIAAGASKTYDEIVPLLAAHGIVPEKTGCMGMCYCEPLVEVIDSEGKSYVYGNVTADKAATIVEEHIKGGRPVAELLVLCEDTETEHAPYIEKQHRILLKHLGKINPESIDSYLEVGGYEAVTKALGSMTPEEVIAEIGAAGLRGRGGAGFPTHLKWKFTREAEGDQKYVVCNADEGDPGAFMDRSLLESNPHSVLEGMIIAGYAIGATEGYVYCRAEYPLAIRNLRKAIADATERGFLGKNILGSGFDFSVQIREGAGAFVCGEETALLMSVEGKRGMPRFRPPFPAQKGLFGRPTCINNVETLANIPHIIREGAASYSSLGTENSKGTKVFALAGKIKRGGLVEIPMGLTINEIVFDIGGGISTGKKFKAVQTGGPSGGCIPADMGDTPVDYDSLKAIGAIMGSGGMLIMDEETCMVDVARFFLTFTCDESCGKCTFCRTGTKKMLEILERIAEGKGTESDIDLLEELAEQVKAGSLCGLGQTAPNPVLTTIKYFRDEYLAHVRDKRCPAKKCKALIRYEIHADACVACGLCRRNCPVNAISGAKKTPHVIDQDVCIRCGLCLNSCKFDAIEVTTGEPEPQVAN